MTADDGPCAPEREQVDAKEQELRDLDEALSTFDIPEEVKERLRRERPTLVAELRGARDRLRACEVPRADVAS